MKIPQTFLTKQESIERKIKDFMERDEERQYFSKDDGLLADDIQLLETLKKGKTREEQETFLALLAKNIPELARRAKMRMMEDNIKRIYLDNPEDYETRGYGYRTRFEMGIEGHLEFHHSLSGNSYVADLDEDYYKDFWPVYEYLNTYPDKKSSYRHHLYDEDFISTYFKRGKEAYDSIILSLRENKNL